MHEGRTLLGMRAPASRGETQVLTRRGWENDKERGEREGSLICQCGNIVLFTLDLWKVLIGFREPHKTVLYV